MNVGMVIFTAVADLINSVLDVLMIKTRVYVVCSKAVPIIILVIIVVGIIIK